MHEPTMWKLAIGPGPRLTLASTMWGSLKRGRGHGSSAKSRALKDGARFVLVPHHLYTPPIKATD